MRQLKRYKLILIVLLSISSSLFATDICGNVTDLVSGDKLCGVNVILKDKGIGTSTDKNGEYRLSDLKPGTYILKITIIGFKSILDSVTVDENDDIIIKNYALDSKRVLVKKNSEIEDYHIYLNKYSQEEILSIKIDSIKYINEMFTIFSTFQNNTDTSIFLFQHSGCMNMILPIIISSKGDTLIWNKYCSDCTNLNINPDSDDFIEIRPYTKISYPTINLCRYDFTKYPKDNYSIQIRYKYKLHEYVYGMYNNQLNNNRIREKYERTSYYLTKVLRGEWTSSNVMYFNNSELVSE